MKTKSNYIIAALAVIVVILLVALAFLLGKKSGSEDKKTTEPPAVSDQSLPQGDDPRPSGTSDGEPSGEEQTTAITADNTQAQPSTEAPSAEPGNTVTSDADMPRNLDISMSAGSLTFVKGSSFSVDYDKSVIEVSTSGDTMTLKNDHSHPSASERRKMDVTITVPENAAFNSVDVEFGAGKLIVHSLKAENLSLELGAGSATFDDIFISGSAEIKEGAGELVISSGTITDLDLKCGAGATRVAAALKGTSEVTAAVGAVDIALKGEEADYSVSFQIGLGACYYNGDKLSRSGTYGDGKNTVSIHGGLGVMRVNVG
ncbi:MAG: DUF4097 family beta strand repeat protein [Clostridia bacterium]|nr:DUF4097 family beta strand repeat protein [Clostridia bacterium]